MKRKYWILSVMLILLASPLFAESALQVTWETTAEAWKGAYGEIHTVKLPPNGYPSQIDGYGSYTGDSSIGSAAVDMGLITYEDGGVVTIRIIEGPYYTKASSYEGWNTIFVFLDEEGNHIQASFEGVLFLDANETFVPEKSPEYFTVANKTGQTLVYLEIYTNDMTAVGVRGTNLVAKQSLQPSDSIAVPFAEFPDLEEAILYRYGQLMHVDYTTENGRKYHQEWYPSYDSLDLVVYSQPTDETTQVSQTLRIENQSGYTITDAYLFTERMEEKMNFSIDILKGIPIEDGAWTDIHLSEFSYLADCDEESLLLLAYDEESYLLAIRWYPLVDGYNITLTVDEYIY